MTRSPKIGNTPVLPNTWRLRRVKDTKFGTDASNEMLLNAAKCQDYSFYRFWVLKGRPKRGDSLPPLSTQIRVNIITSTMISCGSRYKIFVSWEGWKLNKIYFWNFALGKYVDWWKNLSYYFTNLCNLVKQQS